MSKNNFYLEKVIFKKLTSVIGKKSKLLHKANRLTIVSFQTRYLSEFLKV